MRQRLVIGIAVLALSACPPREDVDIADAGAAPDDAGVVDDPLPTDDVLETLCALDDGDLATPAPVADESARCGAEGDPPVNTAQPLFPDDVVVPDAALALHALCARMNPAPGSRDDLLDPALGADLHAWLLTVVDEPPLRRALADVADDPEARVAALEDVWLTGNALEHVLCGDLNPNGAVGGLHLWSEWYLAEREGRADYQCSVDGVDDTDVAAIRFRWRPPSSDDALKPLGSFHVGSSAACMLAIGYHAVTAGLPASTQFEPTFRAALYGERVAFALGLDVDGVLVTLFPVADADDL